MLVTSFGYDGNDVFGLVLWRMLQDEEGTMYVLLEVSLLWAFFNLTLYKWTK